MASSFEHLQDFIRKRMRMSHIYQPVMIRELLQSGNPAGRLRGSRNKLSEEVVCALLRDFRKHGEKAIAKVRRDQPGVYLKVLALLIPREHKLEYNNPIKNLSDQQIEDMIEYIEAALAEQAGGPVKVIEGTTTAPPALEPPKPKNRLMLQVDTAVGPRERMPRKVPSPPDG